MLLSLLLSGTFFINSFMPWMDYRMIKSWKQYEIQEMCVTDDDGFRKLDEDFVVAVPPCYELGQRLVLTIGQSQYSLVVGDIRPIYDDKIEFIVDKEKISPKIKKTGSCFSRFTE